LLARVFFLAFGKAWSSSSWHSSLQSSFCGSVKPGCSLQIASS